MEVDEAGRDHATRCVDDAVCRQIGADGGDAPVVVDHDIGHALPDASTIRPPDHDRAHGGPLDGKPYRWLTDGGAARTAGR